LRSAKRNSKSEKRKYAERARSRGQALIFRGGGRHGRAAAAGLIVGRERRKLRRNYAKLSQPNPMQAGAAPALQLLDLL